MKTHFKTLHIVNIAGEWDLEVFDNLLTNQAARKIIMITGNTCLPAEFVCMQVSFSRQTCTLPHVNDVKVTVYHKYAPILIKIVQYMQLCRLIVVMDRSEECIQSYSQAYSHGDTWYVIPSYCMVFRTHNSHLNRLQLCVLYSTTSNVSCSKTINLLNKVVCVLSLIPRLSQLSMSENAMILVVVHNIDFTLSTFLLLSSLRQQSRIHST